MNVQPIVFLTASLAVHAGLLCWTPAKEPLTLAIGGQAQALNITVVKHAQASVPPQEFAALELTDMKLVAHEQRASKPPATNIITQRPSAQKPTPPQKMQASAITTQRPNAANSSSAINVSEHISAALQNELASRFEYPWLARKRGWQGQVTLSLQVDSSGSLSHWQISRTSGHSVLDRSALKAAQAIRHLPEAETLLDGQPLHLLIPVHYQLLDS